MNRLTILFLLSFIAVIAIGCTEQMKKEEISGDALLAPDYQLDSSWIARPTAIDKNVDVFYLYPTIYSDESPINMDINNKALRAKAENLLVSQAGVYSKHANLFAPLYRQMSMAALDGDTDMFQNRYFQIGADDAMRAFDYYLENINPDRPFILAGHSQGSMVLINLMRKRFDEPALQERLVAAYLIGYSLTRDDLKKHPWLKAASGEDDTGVIITFNTQAPGATDSPVLLPGAICINPLTWSTDGEKADKSLNAGSVFFNDQTGEIDREVIHYVGAQIDLDSGALFATPPEKVDVGGFPPGIYHMYDYPFWYRNLQENAAKRINAYFAK